MSINPVDPKWLEILKASGWQTTAMAIAFAVILALIKYKIIPTTESPYWVALPTIFLVIFGSLSLASMCSALVKVMNPIAQFNRWRKKRLEAKEALKFIPYMDDNDKRIIGYLLYHNQKMFQYEEDGGYAAKLLSKGFIRYSGTRGQILDLNRVPFEVPDHIWAVFEKNRESFPYEPIKGEPEIPPWTISWMLR